MERGGLSVEMSSSARAGACTQRHITIGKANAVQAARPAEREQRRGHADGRTRRAGAQWPVNKGADNKGADKPSLARAPPYSGTAPRCSDSGVGILVDSDEVVVHKVGNKEVVLEDRVHLRLVGVRGRDSRSTPGLRPGAGLFGLGLGFGLRAS